MKIKLMAVVTCLCIVALQSCADHDLQPPPTDVFDCNSTTVSFVNDIKPIINTSCAIPGSSNGCHNGGNGTDLDWRVFSNFQSHSASVKDRITRPAGTAGHMPKEGSIDPKQIQTIVCWVDQGALNN